jgi:hypothetical protein
LIASGRFLEIQESFSIRRGLSGTLVPGDIPRDILGAARGGTRRQKLYHTGSAKRLHSLDWYVSSLKKAPQIVKIGVCADPLTSYNVVEPV